MENIAERLLVLVPGAFVVLVTLVIMLRHHNKQHGDWVKTHREASKESSGVIKKNTEMLGRIGGLIERRIQQEDGHGH